MNKITLNARELRELLGLFNEINESQDNSTVSLEQSHESGIGSVLTATFCITHKGHEGDFTVVISDESDW